MVEVAKEYAKTGYYDVQLSKYRCPLMLSLELNSLITLIEKGTRNHSRV